MNTKILEFLYESNMIESEPSGIALLDAAMAWEYLSKKKILKIPDIMEVHKLLMKSRPIDERYKGQYRDCAIYIGGRTGANPASVPYLMEEWCKAVNGSVKKKEVGDIAKKFHIKYEECHPWIDGNGRTGRIFYNWQRIRTGLEIDVIKFEDVWAYYNWFK